MDTPNLPKTATMSPPLARISNTQVAEFQIPYTSIYHSSLLDSGVDSTPLYYLNTLHSTELIFVINNYQQHIDGYLLISVAFGDETRFGIFMGLPDTIKNPTINYPFPLNP